MKNIIIIALLSFILLGCKTGTLKQDALKPGFEPKLKTVSMDKFMNHGLSKSIPIEFKIPQQYVQASNVGAPITYSYWMPSGKVKQLKKTKNFPTDTGWMYGKISLSIGYSQASDKFIGMDNFVQQVKKAGFKNIIGKRINVNDYPIFILEMEERKSGKQLYSIYLGMKLETNAIYIAYRPPINQKRVGKYVWSNFKSSLKGI